jgi:hypothetical protein
MFKSIAAIGLLLLTHGVNAQTVYTTHTNVTVAGVKPGGRVAMGMSTNPQGCWAGAVYFEVNGGITKQVLAVAMTARVSGVPVRVQYTKNPSDSICTGVELLLFTPL